MGNDKQVNRRKRLISELQRSIHRQGQHDDKDVFVDGLFIRDPSNNHYRLYRWEDLSNLQLNTIWKSRRWRDDGLNVSFVIYEEQGAFKAACGLKVQNPEWNNYYGFKESGELIPPPRDMLEDTVLVGRSFKERFW